jgi:hypothetical protein
MNNAKCRIFLLFLFAMADSQVFAQQQDEPIRNSCTPQEYETYLRGVVRLQQALADARTGEIPVSILFKENNPEFSKVPPRCQQAIESLEAVTPPGRRCTAQQRQEMIAHNGAAKWPQPVRTGCWNF